MSGVYWIVGPGRMGLSLSAALARAGAAREIVFVGRSESAPNHPAVQLPLSRYSCRLPGPPGPGTRVILSVPDGAIAALAVEIARLGAPGEACVALHLSGAQPSRVLEPLAGRGFAVGSLHPLQTVADPLHGAERLRGAFFTFEGSAWARDAAMEIVAAAGGRMLEVHAADKARYHAACVFASNYLVACAAVSTRLLAAAAEVSPEEAARALEPLWQGAVSNLSEFGPPRALTGPVARGDLETVREHLAALDPETRELYRQLALQALALSREAGLGWEAAHALESLLVGTQEGGTDGDEVVRQSRPRRDD